MRQRPRGLEERRIRRLLSKARAHRSASDHVDALSALLVGRPYAIHPLIGSAETPEVFTASLDGFDCVTYVETVLALARAASAAEFVGWLRRIRYEAGRIDWRRRNHYMIDWIRNNTRNGVVRPLSAGVPSTRKDRVLDVVPGLAPRRARFACVPKRFVKSLSRSFRSGDLIFFASTRNDLDVFHCGILVGKGGDWRMRHAARSRGGVVEEDLEKFLESHRMAGVIVARPR